MPDNVQKHILTGLSVHACKFAERTADKSKQEVNTLLQESARSLLFHVYCNIQILYIYRV